MIQQVGRKIELDLTRKQRLLCAKSCGIARLAYNWELTQINNAYEEAKTVCKDGGKPKCKLGSAIDWHRALCAHKKGIPFIYEVFNCCGQEALRYTIKEKKCFI